MQQKHIFISGLHRSGTSLFHKTLCSAEGFSGFRNTGVPKDEGQHLQDVMKPAKYFGGPGKFGFNSNCYMDESHILATEENRKKIQSSWERWWDTSQPFLVEKSPPNIVRTRYLQYLFPDAVFLTIIRHPIAVSLATKKWSGTSMNNLFKHWIKCNETFIEDAKYLKYSYLFKYEDFVSNPKQIMSAISKLLDHDIKLSEYPKIDKNINNEYFKKWKDKYKNNNINKIYYNYLKSRYKKQFNDHGYDIED